MRLVLVRICRHGHCGWYIHHVVGIYTMLGGFHASDNSALVKDSRSLHFVFKYRIRPEELHILSCEKGRGRRPWPFSQLRM